MTVSSFAAEKSSRLALTSRRHRCARVLVIGTGAMERT